MSASVNKVILIGNVGKDPEMRSTNDGQRIANFSIATSESWVDKRSGERREKTEWHRVVVFNEHLAEVVEKYVKKGSKLYLVGALQTRKWTDNDGKERYSTEVVLQKFRGEITLLDSPKKEEAREPDRQTSGEYAAASGGTARKPPPRDLDDDLPF